MARQKQVFSSAQEVAQVWAQRSQNSGRSGSIFFEKSVIYSYRYSWPIGILFDGLDGTRFCLIEEDNPSNSTAVHTGHASAAVKKDVHIIELRGIKDFTSFPAGVSAEDLARLRTALERKAEDLFAEIDRSKDGSWAQTSRLNRVASTLEAHQEIARAFEQDWPALASPAAFRARAKASYGSYTDTNAAKREEQSRLWEEEAKQRRFEEANPLPRDQAIAAWRRGERLTLPKEVTDERGMFGMRSLHCRIRNGKLEIGFIKVPSAMLSKLMNKALEAMGTGNGFYDYSLSLSRSRVSFTSMGDIEFDHNRVEFEELMACAEISAPRVFRKAQAAVAQMQAAEDAEDENEEDEEIEAEDLPQQAPGI